MIERIDNERHLKRYYDVEDAAWDMLVNDRAESFKTARNCINACIRGLKKTVYSYTWRRSDDNEQA